MITIALSSGRCLESVIYSVKQNAREGTSDGRHTPGDTGLTVEWNKENRESQQIGYQPHGANAGSTPVRTLGAVV